MACRAVPFVELSDQVRAIVVVGRRKSFSNLDIERPRKPRLAPSHPPGEPSEKGEHTNAERWQPVKWRCRRGKTAARGRVV